MWRAESQRSSLCAQAPGITSRTWTASSPRYPLCWAWQGGTEGPLGQALFLAGASDSAVGGGLVSGVRGGSGRPHHASGLFLDTPATPTAITSGTALPASCWRISSSWGETLVLVAPAASSPPRASPRSQGLSGWGGRPSWPGGWAAAHPALRPDHRTPGSPDNLFSSSPLRPSSFAAWTTTSSLPTNQITGQDLGCLTAK